MFQPILGKLTALDEGAKYRGKLWDQWLTIRLHDDIEILIFDNKLIAKDIVIGAMHEVILRPTIFGKIEIIGLDSSATNLVWQGIVKDTKISVRDFDIDSKWQLIPGFLEGELERHFVVELTYGAILANAYEVESFTAHTISVSTKIAWDEARWELFGIRMIV